ncbi:Sec-independent protein translocase protein TatB [Nakamurella sp. GG22]
MFGLSWGQIAIIVLVGVFVLGPERIPTAVSWVMTTLRKVRTMAAGAQAELRREIGPELDELRRQVADLQSLKEIQDLRDLRDLHPKRLIGKNILGDEFSGGITGFLGLGAQPDAPTGADPSATNGSTGNGSTGNGSATNGSDGTLPHLPPSMVKQSQPAPTLAAPKLVGGAPPRPVRTLEDGERPPFDPDGT